MSHFRSSRSGTQLFFGLLLTCIGVLLLLDRLDIIYAYDYFRYWPLLVVFLGVVKFLRSKRPAGYITGGLIIFFGLLLSLNSLFEYHIRFREWWPIVIILLGASLLFNRRHRFDPVPASSAPPGEIPDADSVVSMFAVMSECTRTIASQDFRGGEITAIMGGCKLDLRQASIKSSEAILDLFVSWGRIEVFVPGDWHVIMNGHPFMGGMNDRTFPPVEATRKQLVIRGYAIMGAAEVKNM